MPRSARLRAPPAVMHKLIAQLRGGDRRSIGAVPQVVARVLANPSLFAVVFDGISDPDPLVRMRCADAVEKITVLHPEYLGRYAKRVIELAEAAQQQELRWHLAQLLSRLKLNQRERRRVARTMSAYLTDVSKIVKTCAMQTLADIAAEDPELRSPIVQRLQQLTGTGSPAMRARGRKLLARLAGGADSRTDSRPPRSRGSKSE